MNLGSTGARRKLSWSVFALAGMIGTSGDEEPHIEVRADYESRSCEPAPYDEGTLCSLLSRLRAMDHAVETYA